MHTCRRVLAVFNSYKKPQPRRNTFDGSSLASPGGSSRCTISTAWKLSVQAYLSLVWKVVDHGWNSMLERKVTDFESMSESSQRRGIGRVTKLFLSSFLIFFPPTAGLPISDFASMDLKAVMLELMCNCVHRNFGGLKKRTPGKTKVFVFLWKKKNNIFWSTPKICSKLYMILHPIANQRGFLLREQSSHSARGVRSTAWKAGHGHPPSASWRLGLARAWWTFFWMV